MSWVSSIFIGLLTAVLGCFGAGTLATLCVRWYRISSFEGASGYYVVFIALLGTVVGLIGGIVCSRFVPGGEREFLRGLGIACGSMTALLLVITLVCRLAADLPPEINGQSLRLAVEVRCPEGFTIPEKDVCDPFVSVEVLGSKRRQPTGELRVAEAKKIDDRWIVSATASLMTSVSRKFLRIYFNQENDLFAPLPLRSHPKQKDLEWSNWIDVGWNAKQPEPAPEKKFKIRFCVQLVEPPPPEPTYEEIKAREAAEEQAKFDAIVATGEIRALLPHTRLGLHEGRLRAAVERIMAQPNWGAELGELMVDSEEQVATDALRMIEHMSQPPAELLPVIADVGRHIIGLIREVNTLTAEQDPNDLAADNAARRFNSWLVAVTALRAKSGGDFTPQIGEILTLSRVREDSPTMRSSVRRVASYYMHTWAGVAPLAGDPKPR